MNRILTICLAVSGLLLVGCDSADDGGGEYGAKDVCHQNLERQLKAPDSADYSDEVAIESADGNWNLSGSVDAENSFGAKLRASYVCTAIHLSGDNWQVDATLVE